MRGRSHLQLFAILSLLLPIACMGGQGDDPGQTGRDAGVTGGSGGGAGSPSTSGGAPGPETCEPRPDPADDACLACLANNCCEELHFSSGVGSNNITGAELPNTLLGMFFLCVRSCVQEASEADGGLSSSLADSALACGPGCTTRMPSGLSYIFADLIACSTGGPRPIYVSGEEPNFEYGMDEDAGVSDHDCADVCFASF